MEVFIDLTQDELRIAETYAKDHALTLEDAFKSALLKKIRAEHDCVLADSEVQDFFASGPKARIDHEKKVRTAEEPWRSDTLVGILNSDKSKAPAQENA